MDTEMTTDDPIRVLVTFIDPRVGGPQRRALRVARQLRERGIETTFLLPPGDDAFEGVVDGEFEVVRHRLPRIRPPKHVRVNAHFLRTFPSVTRDLRRFIDSRRFDVVHTNMPLNFQSALAAVRSDAATVWHFNDTLTPTPVKQIAGFLGPRLADEVVVAADAVHDYFFEPNEPSRTIYAPVDIDEFDPTRYDPDQAKLRAELSLPESMPVVGTIGNVNPIKGHRYLLEAIARLDESGREVAVPVVGKVLDSRRSYYEDLLDLRADLGLEGRVRFAGFRSDIPELLSLFDVFVLPSVEEACPMVVLEAMAMECPVVATAVGGVPEQLPDADHGWVVTPEDPDALAVALGDALDRPAEAQRRATNARDRVEATFSLSACVDRHEDLYRSVVLNR
jgi:glycosyltransferase involved in cell wall biosynthesis